MKRALLAALTALLLLAGTTGVTPQLEPAAATLYGPMAAPNGVGQGAWSTASEWNGCRPSQHLTSAWWKTCAPADPAPDLKRRSEVKIGASQAATQLDGPGKKSQWKGWVRPVLGAAASDGRSWHTVVQLIGPDTTGAFVGGATVALTVRNGMWRLEQGGFQWQYDLKPYVDDVSTNAAITYNPGATSSSVCATLDESGPNAPQTWCFTVPAWDRQWATWASGLYRGSGNTPFDQGGPQPTYEQIVYLQDCYVTIY